MESRGMNDLDHKSKGMINRKKKEERKEGNAGMGYFHCARK